MKSKILIIIGLLFSYQLVYAQLSSPSIYNNKGQLKADTSLTISSEQLAKWRGIEKILIKRMIETVSYSEMGTEYKLNGIIILSFDIDSTKRIENFKHLKSLGGGLEEIIENSIIKYDYIKSLPPPNNKLKYTYYVAMRFDLIDANQIIETQGVIPISRVNWTYNQQ